MNYRICSDTGQSRESQFEGRKEKQVMEEHIELFIPLHEVQKQSKQMVYRHYGINSQRQKEGRTEVGIMVSSRGGWIWGGTHRASRALVNVLFLEVRDEGKGVSFTPKTLPLS